MRRPEMPENVKRFIKKACKHWNHEKVPLRASVSNYTGGVTLISSPVLSSLLQIVVFLSNKLFLFLAYFVTLKIYEPTVPYYRRKVIPYRLIDP